MSGQHGDPGRRGGPGRHRPGAGSATGWPPPTAQHGPARWPARPSPAVEQALHGLDGTPPDLLCVLVAPGAGDDPDAGGRGRAPGHAAGRGAGRVRRHRGGRDRRRPGARHGPGGRGVGGGAARRPGAHLPADRRRIDAADADVSAACRGRRPTTGWPRCWWTPTRSRSPRSWTGATPPCPGSRWSVGWPADRAGRGRTGCSTTARCSTAARSGCCSGPRWPRGPWSARAAGRSGHRWRSPGPRATCCSSWPGRRPTSGWWTSCPRCRRPNRAWWPAGCTSGWPSTSTPTSTAGATS